MKSSDCTIKEMFSRFFFVNMSKMNYLCQKH